MESEDVVHVLRNVHGALERPGRVLDVHPLAIDFAVTAGTRGLGFVDTREFAKVVAAMDEGVDRIVADGLLEHVRTLRRLVTERFDDGAEALEEADTWEHLRLPAVLRRRLREAEGRPVELALAVSYRLFVTRR